VGLYHDFVAQQEQLAPNILGAMLKQVVSSGGIPWRIREASQMAKGFGGPGLLLSDIVETFKKTLASLPRLFICIDELDGSPLEHP